MAVKRRTIGDYLCEAKDAASVGNITERNRLCDLGITKGNSLFRHAAPGNSRYPDTASRFETIARIHAGLSRLYEVKESEAMARLHSKQARFARKEANSARTELELVAAQRTE